MHCTKFLPCICTITKNLKRNKKTPCNRAHTQAQLFSHQFSHEHKELLRTVHCHFHLNHGVDVGVPAPVLAALVVFSLAAALTDADEAPVPAVSLAVRVDEDRPPVAPLVAALAGAG